MSHESARTFVFALALSVAGASLACSDRSVETNAGPSVKGAAPPSAAGSVVAAAVAGGAASPEAALEQLKTAVNAHDYRSFFNLLVTESQNQMLAGMLIGSAITLAPIGTKPNPDKQKELQAIFQKYGVKDDGAPVAPGPPDRMMEAFGKKLEGVKDRPGLFNDLLLFLEKNSLAQSSVTVVSFEAPAKQGEDKATSMAAVKYTDGRTEKRPVELRKVGGRWFAFLTKWT